MEEGSCTDRSRHRPRHPYKHTRSSPPRQPSPRSRQKKRRTQRPKSRSCSTRQASQPACTHDLQGVVAQCSGSKTNRRNPQRETVVGQLGRLLDSEATLTSSALKQNNLSLLRDKLSDHRRDLARLRATLKEARERANLLGSVRDDISAYRAANPAAAEAEYMLEERGRLDRSHDVADSVLSQAYAVQDSFALQRESLASINRRITLAASQVPGINTLINRISAKKRRDGIIMGSFIAFCFLMFWFFM